MLLDHLPPPAISRFVPVPTTGPLAGLLAVIVKGFCDAIAMRIHHGRVRVAAPLAMLVFSRLYRLAQRVEALTAKLRAGTLRPPRPRPGRVRKPAPPPPKRPWDGVRPSRAFGWLGQQVPESRVWAAHLERWLAEPEAAALLKAAPQAARLFRPLCHIAGIRPDPALIPPLPRRPRKPPPPPPGAAPVAEALPATPGTRPPDPRRAAAEARAKARAETRAEARWAAAYRRSLGLKRRE